MELSGVGPVAPDERRVAIADAPPDVAAAGEVINDEDVLNLRVRDVVDAVPTIAIGGAEPVFDPTPLIDEGIIPVSLYLGDLLLRLEEAVAVGVAEGRADELDIARALVTARGVGEERDRLRWRVVVAADRDLVA